MANLLCLGCSTQAPPPVYKEVLIKAIFVDGGWLVYIVEDKNGIRKYTSSGERGNRQSYWASNQKELPLVGEWWLMKDGRFEQKLETQP